MEGIKNHHDTDNEKACDAEDNNRQMHDNSETHYQHEVFDAEAGGPEKNHYQAETADETIDCKTAVCLY